MNDIKKISQNESTDTPAETKPEPESSQHRHKQCTTVSSKILNRGDAKCHYCNCWRPIEEFEPV